MKDIRELIEQSGISETAKKTAIAVFEAIARAEAKVHGSTPEDVHFHEVGAADSIADIVGTAVGLELLGVEQIVSSPLSEGRGMITCQHGLIPVPAPATLELCMQAGIPLVQTEEEGEMVTPTGAGLVAALAEKVSSIPALKNARIGYGAGEKEFKRPNVLRAVLGDLEESEGPILVLETNIDDSTPEQLGYVMERLLTAGAKDTYFTPVYMKKNRPGVVLTVLCDAELEETMEHIVFTETTTIGVRKRTMERCALPREAKEVETKYGTIRVKVAWYKGQVKIAPEYEDCALLARKNGVPLSTVYAEAMANAREL